MTEKLLQFIWKHRYFNQQDLTLITGESLSIEFPGEENKQQGPDFVNARIRLNGNCWIGSVELHLYSSGWVKHQHTDDENYRNVMLHVVWKEDRVDLKRNIPQLELYNRISRFMLDTYAGWMNSPRFIPCELSATKTTAGKWEGWASRLLISRLNRKMGQIMSSLRLNQYHWEEQLWWMLAANFGNPVNTLAFESVARSIPFSLIAKNRHHPGQLEALLAGQANLLENNYEDPYPMMLKREYIFLKNKYGLNKNYEQVHFLRMRPENFPGIRLSQLATLCTETPALFAWTRECPSLTDLRKKLMVTASAYWDNHYVFDRPSIQRKKILGSSMSDNIILNCIIPLLYTYGKIMPDAGLLKKVISWLETLPAEQNHMMWQWKRIGITVKKAAGSQALMELKKQYCDKRRCLDCEIAHQLLQPPELSKS